MKTDEHDLHCRFEDVKMIPGRTIKVQYVLFLESLFFFYVKIMKHVL